MRIETVFLFDLDGTLVDSVYQHVLAWQEALDAEGIELSVWRIHRKIGMSGGLFMNQLLRETGLEISPERVERLRRLHAEAYRRHAAAIRPLPGARELLAALTEARIPWAIATSGRMETAAQNLAALGVDPAQTPVVTRDQVEVRQARPRPVPGGRGTAGCADRDTPWSWATASGTCWRRGDAARSASACCPAATGRRSWNAAAPRGVRGPGRPAACISTRWAGGGDGGGRNGPR